MIRVGVAGLGKMGLSHLAMIRPHPDVEVAGVCDTTGYVVDVLEKYTGVRAFSGFEAMLDAAALDAVLISTPSRFHAGMVRTALERGLHVFCEKPFVLDPVEGEELARVAESKGLVNQVGYHYRFVAAFQEVKRLLDLGAIGEITHVKAEAYGPVVLKPKGSTWRTQRSEGGGCLYDYAAHPINLVNWYLGEPARVGGTALNKVFSRDTEDEVYGTLYFDGGRTAQISVNWSDESYRKMSTQLTIWGTQGRIYADRQECQIYLRDGAAVPEGYRPGWNVRYTTDMTPPVWFYVRGEEYSAQLDYFVHRVAARDTDNVNSFRSATVTDRVIAAMIADAESGPRTDRSRPAPAERRPRWMSWLRPLAGVK
ncbi:MAG TPA: Gfo/Idh/MocA family oxidoreductase [Zeimonas sp.]|nr:Gfo/Idh/MocA family oxidoreductase [Zeimonas sp.]